MHSLVGKWFVSLGLAAAALFGIQAPSTDTASSTTAGGTSTPAVVSEASSSGSGALTAQEISTRLHDEITALRSQIALAHLNADLPLTAPIALNNQGDKVRQIQNYLSELGFLAPGLVTGYYGKATQTAISKFQDYYVLPKSGQIDRATLDKLLGIIVDRMNLDQMYLPEEKALLNLATSSEALQLQLTNYIDSNTCIPPDTSSASTDTTVTAPAGAPAPTTDTFTIAASSYYFSPNTLSVNAGDTVVINYFDVSGTHNFAIDAFGIKTANLSSGKSTTITFTPNFPGTYTYYSSVSGDLQQGMKGTLTVH